MRLYDSVSEDNLVITNILYRKPWGCELWLWRKDISCIKCPGSVTAKPSSKTLATFLRGEELYHNAQPPAVLGAALCYNTHNEKDCRIDGR